MSSERLPRMRAAALRMVIGVAVVDAVGIALYLFTPLAARSNGRIMLALFWILATLAVLLPGLRAIRTARRS